MHNPKLSKKFFIPLLFLICFLTFLVVRTLTYSYFINRRFRACTNTIFTTDISGNPLNLHYTLAYPESSGIKDYSLSLGTFDPTQLSGQKILLENRRTMINAFPARDLSPDNRLTQQILSLYYETQLLPARQYLLDEALSPSLGTQAQLPILLAEYTFRKEDDVRNYLKLLTSVDSYLESILSFEKLKAQNGTFMSDATADRIISQCSAFIKDPDDNYLASVFSEKIQSLSGISEQKKAAYQKLHNQILTGQLLPAYQSLIDGLYLLKGSGKNPGGLCQFAGGKAYYEYLIKSSCGIYDTVPEIQSRLIHQFQTDLSLATKLMGSSTATPTFAKDVFLPISEAETGTPSGIFSFSAGLIDAASGLSFTSTPSTAETSPEQILEDLQKQIQTDFPAVPSTSYEVKYVHPDLEEHLSPAFYLTPPIDTLSPNDIYINRHANMSGLELYTTLAHEGFPGHLYQTITFASSAPDPVRYLPAMGGYVEGWATYAESFAYTYYQPDSTDGQLAWLNRSLNLCMMSLLDTVIHYNSWNQERCATFLSQLGITDNTIQKEIYQVIVEDPANYLKYYLGYLQFLDLQQEVRELAGDAFHLHSFHQKVLSAGPCQFPILKQWILTQYKT
ncbi:DUF885 domain-containing protein [Blautia sp. TF11-31AT]|nr:DUF885 domain-containing protein [Blautia sp. TF11-31AT]